MKLPRLVTVTAFGLLPLVAIGSEGSPLDAFPAAETDMSRFVINLPEIPRSEENYSVELIAGRVIRTDGVNQVRMDAALESRPLKGWGYTYYEMTGSGQVASTLMAPPPDAEALEAFVHGVPLTIRYNSRLPIVVYVPAGFEIRYRIWAAAAEYLPAAER
jgi:ecotin